MASLTRSSLAAQAALFAALAVFPVVIGAQESQPVAVQAPAATLPNAATTPAPVGMIQLPIVLGPRVDQAGIRRVVDTSPLNVAPDDNLNVGANLALMAVGAAGVVVGLLIGGDGGTMIALGGGVIGLVGFYRYLR